MSRHPFLKALDTALALSVLLFIAAMIVWAQMEPSGWY